MECKKLRTETNEWITIAVNKIDENQVIVSKQILLNFCEKCDHWEDCKDVKWMHKKISQ